VLQCRQYPGQLSAYRVAVARAGGCLQVLERALLASTAQIRRRPRREDPPTVKGQAEQCRVHHPSPTPAGRPPGHDPAATAMASSRSWFHLPNKCGKLLVGWWSLRSSTSHSWRQQRALKLIVIRAREPLKHPTACAQIDPAGSTCSVAVSSRPRSWISRRNQVSTNAINTIGTADTNTVLSDETNEEITGPRIACGSAAIT
jgi:hypothetical protein